MLVSLIVVNLDWNNLQNQIIPILNEKVLGNIKINENTSISLALPNIDWSHFAGCMNKTANQSRRCAAYEKTLWDRYGTKPVQQDSG